MSRRVMEGLVGETCFYCSGISFDQSENLRISSAYNIVSKMVGEIPSSLCQHFLLCKKMIEIVRKNPILDIPVINVLAPLPI